MSTAVQTETMPPGRAPRSRGEAGSAYMAVLLVLVILTIFGLALILITQTEMQVGSNERTLARTFYAADAGIEMATAKALVTSDHAAHLRFPDTQPVAPHRAHGTERLHHRGRTVHAALA